jgi:hypothetical protein
MPTPSVVRRAELLYRKAPVMFMVIKFEWIAVQNRVRIVIIHHYTMHICFQKFLALF